MGIADDAVVGGRIGTDALDVGGGGIIGGLLDTMAAGGVVAVVDTTGPSTIGVLEAAPLSTGGGATPYTGTFSSHGSVGQTAVTRA